MFFELFKLTICSLLVYPASSVIPKLDYDVTKISTTHEEIKRNPHYKDNVFNIPVSTEAGQDLLEHWAVQGFSGLVAAIASRRLPLAVEYQKEKHEKCASKAETLSEHAKCLLDLEDDVHKTRLIHRKKLFNKKMRGKINKLAASVVPSANDSKSDPDSDWIGSFHTARAKREIKVHTRENYKLKAENEYSPFGLITKHLTNSMKLIKKKETFGKWQETIDRIAQQAKEIKEQKKVEKLLKQRLDVYTGAAQKMQKEKLARDDSMNDLQDIEKVIDNEEIRDMVHSKSEHMTEEEKLMLIPMNMLRKAAKIGLAMNGVNTTDFDRKVVRIISPRIMSVVPQEDEAKNNEIDLLSPSLFSLHDDGTGVENDVSLKNILGSLTSGADSQKFLDFIVEATGVSEAVERVEQKLSEHRRLRDDSLGKGPDGQPLYFTKENVTAKYPHEAKKIELLEKLDKTYSPEQLREMNRTGYTILRHDQLELVYGKGSVSEDRKFLNRAKKLSRPQIDREIMATVKNLAHEKIKFEVRRNDIILSPITFSNFIFDPVSVSQPAILSPVMLSSLIGSPAIYGVMILSPWLLVPVILSPRLLSPVVVNPFLLVPIILSPLAFNPFVLCPGSMNPFVLSPLVFAPFILSPQVLTPLILTPFCLGPIILNPLALSPLVLSPFVLSPTILSPQYVTAVVLSPYALSPAWGSDGAMVTVFASPSWLS